MSQQTPSQTVGPYFHYALTPEPYGYEGIAGNRLVDDDATPGRRIAIVGAVLDGEGQPVNDAMIEIWQADANGSYPRGGGGFRGFGRTFTDEDGRFRFETIMPGRVSDGANGLQAPHINVIVFARGMLSHAYTRVYFADHEAENAEDRVLKAVDPARRPTLVAAPSDGDGGTVYRFDIRLQGDAETVFFDV